MFTKKDGEPEHNHRLEVDGSGTGETIDTSLGMPHTHKVKDWVVEKSTDGHTHGVSSDYIKGVENYGNGDEEVTLVNEGESIEEKISSKNKIFSEGNLTLIIFIKAIIITKSTFFFSPVLNVFALISVPK